MLKNELDKVEEVVPKAPTSSRFTQFVVAIPIVIAVAALMMSSAFASEMMSEEELDMEGQVEATWDYEDQELSVDMETE